MEHVTITLARFIAFFELIEIDPRGQMHYRDLFTGLIGKYGFQKFPQKSEDFDLQKGIVLAEGKWELGHIDKVEIYPGGISVDTRSSTDDSERLLNECLKWTNNQFGTKFNPAMIKKRGYVSQLMFYSKAPILSLISGTLSNLSKRITTLVEESYGEKIPYELTSFGFHTDQTARALSPAAFSLGRRLGTSFSENKYFSEAPLPTSVHEELVRNLESVLLGST